MTNTPEGLPSRIELRDGWHLLLVHLGDDERFPDYIICDPEGDRLGMTAKHVGELKAAMSAPTPLESKLAEALEQALNRMELVVAYKAGTFNVIPACSEAIEQARAALEAWKVGK